MEDPDSLDHTLRDADRLRALYEAELFDSSSEEAFDRLTRRVRERTADLQDAQDEILGRLAAAAEYRDEGDRAA